MADSSRDNVRVFSDALVLLKSKADRGERAHATSTSSYASGSSSTTSMFFIVPRLTPVYYQLLVDGVTIGTDVKLPPPDQTIEDCFVNASVGSALCLLRRSEITDPEAPKKPPRLVTRVDTGGTISRGDVKTIATRAQRKGYVCVDVSSILRERDYEACS